MYLRTSREFQPILTVGGSSHLSKVRMMVPVLMRDSPDLFFILYISVTPYLASSSSRISSSSSENFSLLIVPLVKLRLLCSIVSTLVLSSLFI